MPWDQVHTTAELLALRARQLERRDEDLKEAILHLQRMRAEGKDIFDQNHQLREDELKAGDFVLLHDTGRFRNWVVDNKLAFRWLGPYQIQEANSLKGTYFLGELDGTPISGSIAGNRLKRFHSWQILIPDDNSFQKKTFFPADPHLLAPQLESAVSPVSSGLSSPVSETSGKEIEFLDLANERSSGVHENTRFCATRRE